MRWLRRRFALVHAVCRITEKGKQFAAYKHEAGKRSHSLVGMRDIVCLQF
jgi:hypothetical protein